MCAQTTSNNYCNNWMHKLMHNKKSNNLLMGNYASFHCLVIHRQIHKHVSSCLVLATHVGSKLNTVQVLQWFYQVGSLGLLDPNVFEIDIY